MPFGAFTGLQFESFHLFGDRSSDFLPIHSRNVRIKPWVIEARGRTQTESPKIRNRRFQKKYNGTAQTPRLSVFCSDKQFYATLVDDKNKKFLFYGSTLQQSIRGNPACSTIEAAERLGDELVKTCITLGIGEISNYDRNGFARGAKMEAFEIALTEHGFLSR